MEGSGGPSLRGDFDAIPDSIPEANPDAGINSEAAPRAPSPP